MRKLGPSPFVWLQFDEQGKLQTDNGDGPVQQLNAALDLPGVTHIVVLSHGWKNDRPAAQKLYGTLWNNVCTALQAGGHDPATMVVAGVLWPAKKYDADYDGAQAMAAEVQAGALKAFDQSAAVSDLSDEDFESGLAIARDFLGDDAASLITAAHSAADDLSNETAARFFSVAREKFGYLDSEAGAEPSAEAALFEISARSQYEARMLLLKSASGWRSPIDPVAGEINGLGDWVTSAAQGIRSGIVWMLNQMTYYTMKKRAGTVGEGLARTFADIVPARETRLHLVGHSFGGRLVTASAAALTPPQNLSLHSVTLLQAAYSHYGMTAGRGPFAAALDGRVKGSFAITHTHNDLACTLAYPLASRLSGDTTQALGDHKDPYGAMGANGPQALEDAMITVCDPATFALKPGIVNTVNADTFIQKTDTRDAHNNVANERCGALVAAVLCS
ncbi:MAG: hypothetical protein WCY98_12195 [Castellaniella sp.]